MSTTCTPRSGATSIARAPCSRTAARTPRVTTSCARTCGALEELKLAVPGADWQGIEKRTRRLEREKLSRPRGQRATVITALSIFAFAVLTWTISIMPVHKESRREVMRRELSEISTQRKLNIEMLRVELGVRCDLDRARELAKSLAMDGRSEDAHDFGLDYMARCGDDLVVDNWANAPKPPAR